MPPTNWPKNAFVTGSGTMKAPVLPSTRTVKPRVRPMTPNMVPIVMMSDGTPVRITRKPLTKPTSRPTPSDAEDAHDIRGRRSGRKRRHGQRGAGMIAPTEMSSSPAIIRSPIGSATMPISAATFSQLEKPRRRQRPRRQPPRRTDRRRADRVRYPTGDEVPFDRGRTSARPRTSFAGAVVRLTVDCIGGPLNNERTARGDTPSDERHGSGRRLSNRGCRPVRQARGLGVPSAQRGVVRTSNRIAARNPCAVANAHRLVRAAPARTRWPGDGIRQRSG